MFPAWTVLGGGVASGISRGAPQFSFPSERDHPGRGGLGDRIQLKTLEATYPTLPEREELHSPRICQHL